MIGRLWSVRLRASNANDVPPCTIGADFMIEGNISCQGTAQVDGRLKGNIECENLVVGRNAHILGDIRAADVVVYGVVDGNIHCSHLSIMSNASVKGDVFHQGLVIEKGASFFGRSDRVATDVTGSDIAPVTRAKP